MPKPSLSERVGILERNMDGLQTLSARVTARVTVVESQIGQLRDEMRVEFSAVRQEMKAMGTSLGDEMRAEIQAGNEAIHAEIRTVDESLRAEIRTLDESLRTEIRSGDEETRRYMHVLHEDVISRIAQLQEAGGARTKRRR